MRRSQCNNDDADRFAFNRSPKSIRCTLVAAFNWPFSMARQILRGANVHFYLWSGLHWIESSAATTARLRLWVMWGETHGESKLNTCSEFQAQESSTTNNNFPAEFLGASKQLDGHSFQALLVSQSPSNNSGHSCLPVLIRNTVTRTCMIDRNS